MRPPTPRQRECAALLAEGLTPKEVAARLRQSHSAVRQQLYGNAATRFVGLYKRIGARSRVDVAVWWLMEGRDGCAG